VGANPVDRGKPGSELHLVSERGGLPLTAAVTAANVNDTSVFAALLDDVPAVLTPAPAAAPPARQGRCRQGLRQRRQPCLPAPPWDHAADRPAWDRVIEPAGTAPVGGRADAVVAVVLPAPWGALGPGLQAVVRLRDAGLCACLLQAALTRQQERNDVLAPASTSGRSPAA
jgi:hypothetical protein